MLETAVKPRQLCNHIWNKFSLMKYIYLRYNQHVFGSDNRTWLDFIYRETRTFPIRGTVEDSDSEPKVYDPPQVA